MTKGNETVPIDTGWGSHRSAIADAMANCADHVSRLQRSLTSETASERRYFVTHARDLLHAARDLSRLTEDVEHLLIVCGSPVADENTKGEAANACALPLNHYGAHDAEPLPSLAVQVRDRARHLTDRADEFGSWVNRLGLLSDRLRAFEVEKEFDPEWHEVFFNLDQDSRSISHAASAVCETTQQLIYEVPQEEWDEMDRWEDEEDDDPGINPPIEVLERPAPKVRRARGLDL